MRTSVMSHMPAASLRIGALSSRTGHSIHAIRWFEAQGLMPGVQRDDGGRRVKAAAAA